MAIVLLVLPQGRGRLYLESFRTGWQKKPITPLPGKMVLWPESLSSTREIQRIFTQNRLMKMIHPALLPPARLLRACQVTRTRVLAQEDRTGNKVETAVVLTHSPTGIVAEANERRHQGENLSAALFRLRVKLALEIRGQFLDSQNQAHSGFRDAETESYRSIRVMIFSLNAGGGS